MTDLFDVAVIGGGPGGYAAALKAAELGAKVALVEAEKPGGACVHHACIPTNIILDSALTHLEARELTVMGLFDTGDGFSLLRAAARKDKLVRKLADGIVVALKLRKVQLIAGRATFADSHTLNMSDGSQLRADTVVIATGTRWERPLIEGISADRVLTADAVQALPAVPESAVVLGDGPGGTAFGLEYAMLLALCGSNVSVVTSRSSIVPALDAAVAEVVKASLEGAGILVFASSTLKGKSPGMVQVDTNGVATILPAEVVVVADPRAPFFETLGLANAGVTATDRIPVDSYCRTNIEHIFAVGDVTGGLMLTNVATHMGEVAGINAAGGEARTRLTKIPNLLHLVPEVGWIGLTEEEARALGYSIKVGIADLSYNARALALGAREGIVKIIADAEIGELLGVHIAGPAASEMLAVATAVMQSEVSLSDLAAMVQWHPSVSEGLVEAARRALQ